MPSENQRLPRHHLVAGIAIALAACASAPPAPPPVPEAEVVAAPAPEPAPQVLPAADDAPPASVLALAHADRIRSFPTAELAQEIARLAPVADDGAGAPATQPLAQVQLALTLLQRRGGGDATRAGQLLQRVLGQATPEASLLHPLARLLQAQLAEQRRLEDQFERQGQQLRDAQRRADQLNDRLDALRAIERGRPRTP